MSTDLRGNPVGCSEPAALAAAEKALWRMMSFYEPPLQDLDDAIAHAPGWLLPRVMKAGFLLSLTESPLLVQAQQLLQQAEPLAAQASPREQAHLQAVQQVAAGRWPAACRTWDELLVQHPRDALALQWAHLWDFYRGDAAGLRGRPTRALPQWSEADPLYPHVLALQAFGLEESNLYPQAEDAGRRALSLDARAPWAVHAVAHVMEMQGRFEEGSAWLRQHQGNWAESNGFSGHLWWHKALFRLEGLDLQGALRLYDTRISGEALQITLQRVDAASLLWRLRLLGVDVHERATGLVQGWRVALGESGYYAFNDVHWVMALLAADELPEAEAWVARCAERVMRGDDTARANQAMAREVGLPLMRALLQLTRGEAAAAAQALYAVRTLSQRVGGSHAQREVVDQTLLHAATQSRALALGRAVLNERLWAKPATPLSRHWQERLSA